MNPPEAQDKMAKARQAKADKAAARRRVADKMKERRLEAAKANEVRKSLAELQKVAPGGCIRTLKGMTFEMKWIELNESGG